MVCYFPLLPQSRISFPYIRYSAFFFLHRENERIERRHLSILQYYQSIVNKTKINNSVFLEKLAKVPFPQRRISKKASRSNSYLIRDENPRGRSHLLSLARLETDASLCTKYQAAAADITRTRSRNFRPLAFKFYAKRVSFFSLRNARARENFRYFGASFDVYSKKCEAADHIEN